MSGNDYISLIDHDITFTAGGPTSIAVVIQIRGDNIVETNENFVVSLSSQSSPTLSVIDPITTAITIVDNDGKDITGFWK